MHVVATADAERAVATADTKRVVATADTKRVVATRLTPNNSALSAISQHPIVPLHVRMGGAYV